MGTFYNFYLYARVIIESLCEFLVNSIRFTRIGRRRYAIKSKINDKVVVITGANTGIGKVTAKELATRGAKVIIGCRDVDKGNKVIEEIREENPNSDIRVIKLDLSSLASVRKFAQQVNREEKQIDVLINNAGVMATPKWQTEDGFEMQFGTNHLGHFLLTLLLLDRIKASPNGRIVNVSALAHVIGQISFDDINLNKSYAPIKAYTQSKLANVLFTSELAKRLVNTNIKAYSLHPGIIRTELQRHVIDGGHRSLVKSIFDFIKFIFFLDPYLGAQTTLYCALEEKLHNESGYYYSNCKRVKCMTKNATDDESAKRLWSMSCSFVGVEDKQLF